MKESGKGRKTQPLMRRLNRWAWTEILAALLLMIAVLVNWWMTEWRETESEMNYLLSVYGEQIESRFEGMNRVMGILLEENGDLALMGAEDEAERQHAMVRLKRTLQSTLRIDSSAEWGVMANSAYQAEIQAGEKSPSVVQKERMAENALLAAKGALGMTASWEEVHTEGEVFFRRAATRQGQAIHLYVRRESVLGQIQNPEGSGMVWEILNGAEESGKKREGSAPLHKERTLAGTPFRLRCVRDFSETFGRLRGEIAVLVSMAVLLLAFTLYLRRALRRSLIDPMAQLESEMRKIQEGDYELQVSTQSDAREFQQMTGTLNQLLEEVIQLRVRELEKQLALQEANQKYIRLQLRPHFFLNAMTTVSALSAKNRNQEIQTYIDALSKNIRYMFSAGMHTVPVREEMLHVQNYLKMQELKYPGCVFSYVELPEELEDWPIPQMIIHTVVENEYKYAVSRDHMVMLLIRASRENWRGQEVLLIEIEDDGQGYPPEVLERINGAETAAEGGGNRVGLWSIRRMMELMYEQDGLLELANQVPHGAIARIRVPREAVHEVQLDDDAGPAFLPEKKTAGEQSRGGTVGTRPLTDEGEMHESTARG